MILRRAVSKADPAASVRQVLEDIETAINSIVHGAVGEVGNVGSTGVTPVTISTIPITEEVTTLIEAYVVARRASSGEGAAFLLRSAYRRAAGVVTLIPGGTALTIIGRDDAAWTSDLFISGTNVLVRGTGVAAAAIRWNAQVDVRTVGV